MASELKFVDLVFWENAPDHDGVNCGVFQLVLPVTCVVVKLVHVIADDTVATDVTGMLLNARTQEVSNPLPSNYLPADLVSYNASFSSFQVSPGGYVIMHPSFEAADSYRLYYLTV